MNYKMDDKEMLCTDAMLVTNTQISCNISAVAEVQGGSGSTNDKNNKRNTTGITTNEQRNCNNVEHSAGLRPPKAGSRARVCNADSTVECVSSRSFHDVTKLRANMSLATLSNRLHNIAKHKEPSAMH